MRAAPPAPLQWSVVIPAHDEARRLPRYLREVVGYFDGHEEPYEVVVDDGSADDTGARVREFAAEVASARSAPTASGSTSSWLRAQRRGYRIAEVPVNWADQPGSQVGVLEDGPRMLARIVGARLRLAREARGGRP